MHEIYKQFDFCYGHRVHCQCLNNNLSLNALPKCRHWHGHNGIVRLYLSNDTLDDQQMVTDFNNLNFFKEFIDKVLDHKFIIDISDPAFQMFVAQPVKEYYPDKTWCDFFDHNEHNCWVYSGPKTGHVIEEVLEGLVIVQFVPTSERLCQWLYEIATNSFAKETDKQLISAVEFFETPKTRAIYKP